MQQLIRVANATFGGVCQFYTDPEARAFYDDGLSFLHSRIDNEEDFLTCDVLLRELRDGKAISNAAMLATREDNQGIKSWMPRYEHYEQNMLILDEHVRLCDAAIVAYHKWAADPGNGVLRSEFYTAFDAATEYKV